MVIVTLQNIVWNSIKDIIIIIGIISSVQFFAEAKMFQFFVYLLLCCLTM